MKKHLTRYGSIIIIVIAFGIFIWPGIYKYDKLNQKFPVRINRITGSTDVLYQSGWQSISNKTGGQLSTEELVQLKPNLKIKNQLGSTTLDGNLYNGTNKDLSNILYQVTVYKSDGSINFTRKYENSGFMGYGYAAMNSNPEQIYIDFNADSNTKLDVQIVGATINPSK